MTSQTEKTIQGLYPASGSEGSFWFLLARVVLARFVREENTQERRLLRRQET